MKYKASLLGLVENLNWTYRIYKEVGKMAVKDQLETVDLKDQIEQRGRGNGFTETAEVREKSELVNYSS
ncbi:hypothetical protein EJP82_17075 [Paenibacillus anaericanus]|uniref:Uncharacterized protein n=1 Tax=Paenibacillus anaericanus TaxID=170367 RepID=A0A433Y6U6_9BACL|nr:hypothetical protein EJP82_17075 [Paenibacillus anaericanus]